MARWKAYDKWWHRSAGEIEDWKNEDYFFQYLLFFSFLTAGFCFYRHLYPCAKWTTDRLCSIWGTVSSLTSAIWFFVFYLFFMGGGGSSLLLFVLFFPINLLAGVFMAKNGGQKRGHNSYLRLNSILNNGYCSLKENWKKNELSNAFTAICEKIIPILAIVK